MRRGCCEASGLWRLSSATSSSGLELCNLRVVALQPRLVVVPYKSAGRALKELKYSISAGWPSGLDFIFGSDIRVLSDHIQIFRFDYQLRMRKRNSLRYAPAEPLRSPIPGFLRHPYVNSPEWPFNDTAPSGPVLLYVHGSLFVAALPGPMELSAERSSYSFMMLWSLQAYIALVSLAFLPWGRSRWRWLSNTRGIMACLTSAVHCSGPRTMPRLLAVTPERLSFGG